MRTISHVVRAGAFVLIAATASAQSPRIGRIQQMRPVRAAVALVAGLPAGARVQYDPHNCLDNKYPCATDADPVFVSPYDGRHYFFVWNVERVPGAGAVRWQVLYSPLARGAFASVADPGGIVLSGLQAGQQDEVELDLLGLAHTLGMTAVEPPAGRAPSVLHLPSAPPGPGPRRRAWPAARCRCRRRAPRLSPRGSTCVSSPCGR